MNHGIVVRSALCAATLAASGAAAQPTATQSITPFLDFEAEQTKASVDVGVEVNASKLLRIRPALSVGRPDPDESTADFSPENLALGTSLQLLLRFGLGVGHDSPGSQLSVGLEGRWSMQEFSFNPEGGAEQSKLGHSWELGLVTWWFGGFGSLSGSPGAAPIQAPGQPPAPIPQNYARWLAQPQLKLGFSRNAEAADESFVVRPPNEAGLQLAEKLTLEPPSTVPKLSVLLAVPLQPPKGRFAFGPALRFTSKGADGEWTPTGSVSRLRLEFWTYFFAFDDGPAVRVGVAPYSDWRLSGSDKREAWVGGVLLELRSGSSRLEY